MEDFLAAEEAIIARLAARMPKIRILGAVDLDGLDVEQQATPAVYVLFDGARPGRSAAAGRSLRIAQRWGAVVAVRNLRDRQSGAGARKEAGPLIAQVIRALAGWTPQEGMSPLTLAAVGSRPGYRDGFFYYAVLFDTTVFMTVEG